jgi:hypothetical protein
MSMIRTNDLRFSLSRRDILTSFAAVLALPLVTWASRAAAEAADQGPGQIPLTAKHIEQYIAAFKELAPLIEKLDAAGDKADPKLEEAVEAVIKKHGFRDIDEYDSVANSIVAVLDGIDPKTKQYTDPVASIKQEIADIQKDKSMSAADRKKAIAELNAELQEVQTVQHKGNIPLVLKYYDQLSALMPQQ